MIQGCDYHPSVQQIAWVDTESGECGELRLTHCEAPEQFKLMLENNFPRARALSAIVTAASKALSTGNSRRLLLRNPDCTQNLDSQCDHTATFTDWQ
jgi:hypothetical protein